MHIGVPAPTAYSEQREKNLTFTVHLCNPQPVLSQGLKTVLEGTDEFQLTGSSASLEQASRELERAATDIVLVDRCFGMHSLLGWINQTTERHPRSRVILWAADITDVECFRALQGGARGIVKKTASLDALLHCLRTVSGGGIWTEDVYLKGDSPLDRPRTRPLTQREQQVAGLVSKGMKNREIGEELHIATGTVKIHLMHIFEKTGIRDRFELALHGLRLACERDQNEAAIQSTGERQGSEASVPVNILK